MVLEKPAINGTLATDVQAYLHETLGAVLQQVEATLLNYFI